MWYTLLRIKIATMLHDERGDLSTYLAQGILALAALTWGNRSNTIAGHPSYVSQALWPRMCYTAATTRWTR